MTKKLLTLVTVLAMSVQITSCTSNNSHEDSEVIENADVDKIEAEDSAALGDEAALGDDASLQAALGEAPPPAEEAPSEEATPELSLETAATEQVPPDVAAAPTLDESSLNDIPQPAVEEPQVAANTEPALIEQPPMEDPAAAVTATEPIPEAPVAAAAEPPVFESSGANTAMESEAPRVSKPKVDRTIKKIATTQPYKIAKGWVNTVYVARPGETLRDIAKKIYAIDGASADAKVKELKNIAENGYLKNRSARPGDKVYYISPNRPDDSAKTLFYYEDMGMVPETYVAKSGDTLKKVGRELLGYRDGNKELFTSNPVESLTGKLAEGETIKYWRSASGVTSVASNTNTNGGAQLIDQTQMPAAPEPQAQMPPPPPADTQLPPPPVDTASLPPPPDQLAASGEMPPPPDAQASLPPPPPPPSELEAPPAVDDLAAAPTKKTASVEEESEEGAGGLDDDTMMSLGAVGVLTAALAFALIRRKKKKAADQAAAMAEEINVGT